MGQFQSPPLCLVTDARVEYQTWRRVVGGSRAGSGGGSGWGQLSLEPSGPGESAGLCPNPPAHPSQLLLWCVVRASLVMCSLRFSEIRGLVARLTAPPSSALHLRVGRGLRGCPPLLALSLPRVQCSLPVTLRKDLWGPERDQGAAGTCPQLGFCQASPASSARGMGLLPQPLPHKEVPGSIYTHFLWGPLVPSKTLGAPLPPDVSATPIPMRLLFGPCRNFNQPPPLISFLHLPPPHGCF